MKLPIEAASTEPSPPSASSQYTRLANVGGDDAIDAALADLERALLAAPEEELSLIAAGRLREIVEQDPRKAARFAELQSASNQRDVLIRHVSQLWGESDAEGALAWAQSLPDARESNLARDAACASLSRTNPAAAIEHCAEGADTQGEANFQGIFQTWARADAAAAGKWLDAQPASASIDKLRERYVQVLAQTNPSEALRMTQETFTAPADRDEAILAVLHQWGLQDLRAARDWAENDAPDEIKARALAEIEGLESYAATQR